MAAWLCVTFGKSRDTVRSLLPSPVEGEVESRRLPAQPHVRVFLGPPPGSASPPSPPWPLLMADLPVLPPCFPWPQSMGPDVGAFPRVSQGRHPIHGEPALDGALGLPGATLMSRGDSGSAQRK